MKILWCLSIVLIYYLIVLSYVNADTDEPTCFIVPSKNCTLLKNGDKCDKIEDDFAIQIFCCNITTEKEISQYMNSQVTNNRQITAFHLRDSSLSYLNVNIFDEFKSLTSLSISESNISRITGLFDKTNLHCLNISGNTINEIYPRLIMKQKALTNIVMANNTNVVLLPDLPISQVRYKLDLSGNLQLSCKYLINITLTVSEQNRIDFINKNSTVCSPPNAKLFSNDSFQVRMGQLDQVKEIYNNCPVINAQKKCTCTVHSLDAKINQPFAYHASVNCSNLEMTSLPNKLPSYTRVLDISNNNITSFDGIENETYNNIIELYADNNNISSLKPLEGTEFLYHFQKLSLRNNKINQIQIYMLSNVFDRYSGTVILLAKNELICECNTASQTKMWLITNKEHIPDFNEIFTVCSNSRMKVIDMNQKDLCSKPTNWKGYIRYLIYMEISLFVLLIGKVSYDYYIFKTFGYLPWPASKMPKLPCDWCFET